MKIVFVAGARPNFMKVAPILRVLAKSHPQCSGILVHTGQHYAPEMSDVFLEDLGLPSPLYSLGVGSGTHAQQTARVMLGLEDVLRRVSPDWVVVVGDVNSTVGAALTAVKMGLRTAHVEAGLRSGDRTMPEEINRVVTDAICDLLLTPSEDTDQNLLREGVAASRIVRVGNVMIDSLCAHLPAARALRTWRTEGLTERTYLLVTLHRPSNVDDPRRFHEIMSELVALSHELPIVFPMHPRTRALIPGQPEWPPWCRVLPPLGYLAFLSMLSAAGAVRTDSGGVQEESAFLGIPCLTFRTNTERPVTIKAGSNTLIGTDPRAVASAVRAAMSSRPAPRPPIPL